MKRSRLLRQAWLLGYRNWLVEQRAIRKRRGIWSDQDATGEFPAGHPDEEIIVGFRAWKVWKDHFSIKRRYDKD